MSIMYNFEHADSAVDETDEVHDHAVPDRPWSFSKCLETTNKTVGSIQHQLDSGV